MGVIIKGTDDTVKAADGSLSIEGFSIKTTGIGTFDGGVQVGSAATIHSNGNLGLTGIITATNFKTGDSNVHNTGYNVGTGASIHSNGNAALAGIVTANGGVVVGAAATIFANGNIAAAGIVTAATFVPTVGQLSDRNVIINGDMRIAQRYTSTTSINEYIVDRWRSYGGALGATWSQQTDATAYPRSRYALRQHRTASDSQTNNTGVGQGIETKNSLQLAGETVTLSFKARCGANFSASSNYLTSRINGGEGTDENPFGMTNTNGDSQNNTLTTSVQSFTHTWTIPSDKTQVTVLFDYTPVGTAGANDWFEIAEVQLEVGSVATPFEFRNYGDELARCQRYFQLLGASQGTYDAMSTGSCASATAAYVPYRLITTMRATPTFSLAGSASDFRYTRGGDQTPSNIALDQAGQNMVAVTVTVSSCTADNATRLFNVNTTGGLQFIAEL